MTILEYIDQLITKELQRLKQDNLPIQEYETKLVVHDDGFQEFVMGDKTRHRKLVELRSNLINSQLYKHHKFNEYSFKTFTAEQPYQKVMLDKAKKYANNPKGTFVLSGQTGLGKSHLCTAIVKTLMLREHKVKYIVWQEELDRMKGLELWERSRKSEELGNVEVLYLDDFLKTSSNDGNITESDLKVTNNIINMRYVRNLPTIISTELDYNQIANIHASMAGRLLEMTDSEDENYFISVGYKKERNYRERFAPNKL